MKRFLSLALFLIGMSGCATPPTTFSQVTAGSPYEYCAKVGTRDKPELSVVNDQNNTEIVAALKRSRVIAEDAKLKQDACQWRCMDKAVYACCTGANLPCDSKADTNQQASEGMHQYCAQNPGAPVIPAYVTGHTTVYAWKCSGKSAVITQQTLEVDGQGYQKAFWHRLTAP